MKKILILTSLFLLTILVGCTGAKVSPAEKNQMRTKTFEANYETAYRATMTVLENQGYTIDNTDMSSGLIRANVAKDEWSKGGKAFMAAFTGVMNSGIKTYDLSSTVTKISDKSTRIRINISLKTERKSGFSSNSSVEEINDAEIYNMLFNEIQLEILRMIAMN